MQFNIYQVAQLNALQRLNKNVGYNRTAYVCPFCDDKKGRFTLSVSAGRGNVYKCFHCDEAGGQVTLHRKLNGFNTNSDAIKDIEKRLKESGELTEIKPLKVDENTEKNVDRKPKEYLHKVYLDTLKLCVLDAKHEADLLRRGFTKQAIKKWWFRSTPKHTLDVCRSLINLGYDLEGVPGFYINKDGFWDMNVNKGYFCPVWDFQNNLILGFQIRLDNPKEKRKYVWFSSVNRKGGCSSHSPATFLKGDSSLVIITEGILKATLTYEMLGGKFSVIGVAGAGTLSGLEPYQNYLEDKTILEAYDMDKRPIKDKPESVKKANNITKYVIKLKNALPKSCVFTSLYWNYDDCYWKGEIKGIDDYLVSLNANERFLYSSVLEQKGGLK